MKLIKHIAMSLIFFAAISATLTAATGTAFCQCPGGCCSGGSCTLPQYRQPQDNLWHAAPLPRYDFQEPQTPTPAWRYEQCKGKYRSVVRIVTHDGGNVRSKGSGCVVRWGRRVLVVTAAHVVRDAKRVFVRGRKAWHRCRVLRRNRVWDVAVLEPLGESQPAADLEATDIAWRETGTLRPGDRVESCGFGPDERLAVNSGRVLKFNRASGSDAADWLCMSGPARQGDSGGPVLNQKGELVGVLWGTNGKTVVATQCGRLHEILRAAAGPFRLEQKYEQLATRPMVPVQPVSAGVSAQVGLFGDRQGILPLCPPRRPQTPQPAPQPNVVVQADPRVGNALQSIDTKLDVVVENTSPPQAEQAPSTEQPLPAFAVLAAVAGVVVGFIVFFAAQKGN